MFIWNKKNILKLPLLCTFQNHRLTKVQIKKRCIISFVINSWKLISTIKNLLCQKIISNFLVCGQSKTLTKALGAIQLWLLCYKLCTYKYCGCSIANYTFYNQMPNSMLWWNKASCSRSYIDKKLLRG